MLQKRTLFTAWTILGLFFFCLSAKAQNPNKKTLGHEELVSWNRITQSQISHDGKWLMYNLNPEEGDPTLIIRDLDKERDFTFERTSKGHFSTDNAYAVFLQSPPQDSLKALRRQKVKEDKLPKDTLVIFELATRNVRKIARVKSYQLPAKWPGWLAYHMEPAVPEKKENESDSTKVAEVKKENKKNGSKLFMLQLGDTSAIELGYVSSYLHADEAPGWLAQSTGDDSLLIAGLYYFAGSGDEWIPVYTDTLAKFGDMALSKQGGQAAFLTHSDTTEAQIPPFEVHYWKPGMNKTTLIADSDSDFVPEEWIVSSNRKPAFSEDGSRLFFGLSPKPVLQDTSLLPEEIVQVEVWHWNDERLYPQQMERLKEDKARSWLAVYHIEDQKAHFLQPEAMDNLLTADEGNARYAVAYDQSPYYKMVSWEGFPSRRDLLLVDLDTGTKTKLAEGVKGSASLSPKGKYAYWFSSQDTIWKGIRLADQAKINWTDNSEDPVFYQEEHDTPSVPWSYGIGAWMENDAAFLLYDRFDIWYVDPAAPGNKRRLTRGREKETSYRYIQLDRDKRFLKADETILLRTFSDTD
ncbi:MAG: hypothetical protein GYB31_14980 [Bacteroidetes bacterium]|nr:hypothetical protein [Bacteroidota bacterium]